MEIKVTVHAGEPISWGKNKNTLLYFDVSLQEKLIFTFLHDLNEWSLSALFYEINIGLRARI